MSIRKLFIAIPALLPLMAQALPIDETVTPGQYFWVDFTLSSVPSGYDLLMANGPGSYNGVTATIVDLYSNNTLVATWTNPSSNTSATFFTPGSGYTGPGQSADLSSIFQGANTRIEFHPVFDPSVSNPVIEYQLTDLGATKAITDDDLAPLAPATITAYGVETVPLPGALTLFASCLSVLLLRRKS